MFLVRDKALVVDGMPELANVFFVLCDAIRKEPS